MIELKPDLRIRVTNDVTFSTYRFSFYMPRGDGFQVRCKAPVILLQKNDSLSIEVESDEDQHQFRVMVLEDKPAGESYELATVVFSGDAPDDFAFALQDAVQLAFFNAIDAVNSVPVAPVPVAVASDSVAVPVNKDVVDSSVSVRKRFTWKRAVLVSVVLVGTSLMAIGLYRGNAEKKEFSPYDVSTTKEFDVLNQKIKQQISDAAKSETPAINGINGQKADNVALETMRAMGLDPGKANAGCLVGVH